MKRLLFGESPLLVSPPLARILGVDEAIVMQQIHYLVEKNKKSQTNFRDDYYWTYSTYEDWQKNYFSFWSARSVKRVFSSLVKKNLLVTGMYNKLKLNKTNWYRINYLVLDDFIQRQNVSQPCVQICHNDVPDLDTPLPENNKDIKDNTSKKFFDDDSEEMIIVKFFISKILEIDKDIKVPNTHTKLQTWCKTIDYILRIDKRDKREVCLVIKSALNNTFWQKNILSPKSLRDKYDKLKLIMKDEKNKNNSNNFNQKSSTDRENIRKETYLHLEKLKAEKIAADTYREELRALEDKEKQGDKV